MTAMHGFHSHIILIVAKWLASETDDDWYDDDDKDDGDDNDLAASWTGCDFEENHRGRGTFVAN